MGIDFEKSLGAVTHTVSELTKKDGKPVRNITLERSYSTTSNYLLDAVTNPERLERFFAPVSGELELNGQYQIKGNANGTITECVPPEFFAATWEFGGEVSWIEYASSQRRRLDPDWCELIFVQ